MQLQKVLKCLGINFESKFGAKTLKIWLNSYISYIHFVYVLGDKFYTYIE